jgi:hypothetical protein
VSGSVRRDVVILACAGSAGIHGALAPTHFGEGAVAGTAFVAATVVLALLAIAITRASQPHALVAAAGVTFAGLIASYALATTTGLPLLHDAPEPVDALALFTKAVEATGLFTAWSLIGHPPRFRIPHPTARERKLT